MVCHTYKIDKSDKGWQSACVAGKMRATAKKYHTPPWGVGTSFAGRGGGGPFPKFFLEKRL
jgi:hypothetical protein